MDFAVVGPMAANRTRVESFARVRVSIQSDKLRKAEGLVKVITSTSARRIRSTISGSRGSGAGVLYATTSVTSAPASRRASDNPWSPRSLRGNNTFRPLREPPSSFTRPSPVPLFATKSTRMPWSIAFCAVTGPTAPMSCPGKLRNSSFLLTIVECLNVDLTALALTNKIASKFSIWRRASFSGPPLTGAAGPIVGNLRTSAPARSSSCTNESARSDARVTTMHFPARGWLALSNGSSRELQNPARSRIEQFLCDFATERLGFLFRTAASRSASTNAFPAIRRQDARVENELTAFESAPRAQRQPAAALQIGQHRSLCGNRERCCAINQFLDERKFIFARRKEFKPQRALTNSGKHNFRRENFGNAVGGVQPVEARFHEDHRPHLDGRTFAKARIHIASDFDDFKIASELAKLRCTPQAARTDTSALWKFVERLTVLRDERIARIFARKHNCDLANLGKLGGNILHAVHGQIRAVFNQRVLKFFREDASNPDLFDLRGGKAVAGRLHDDDLALDSERFRERVAQMIGLPERQSAAASANAQRLQSLSSFFAASRPKRCRSASSPARCPRISRLRRSFCEGCSRTRSISSSVMCAMRARSSGDTSSLSASFSRMSISRCL